MAPAQTRGMPLAAPFRAAISISWWWSLPLTQAKVSRTAPTQDGGATMSGLQIVDRDRSANPLDVLEQIVAANEWSFERRSDGEMAAEAPGKWCDYGLYFSWSSEISAMSFSCA